MKTTTPNQHLPYLLPAISGIMFGLKLLWFDTMTPVGVDWPTILTNLYLLANFLSGMAIANLFGSAPQYPLRKSAVTTTAACLLVATCLFVANVISKYYQPNLWDVVAVTLVLVAVFQRRRAIIAARASG